MSPGPPTEEVLLPTTEGPRTFVAPEAILDRWMVRQGRRAATQALVQWTGLPPYEAPPATWESLL